MDHSTLTADFELIHNGIKDTINYMKIEHPSLSCEDLRTKIIEKFPFIKTDVLFNDLYPLIFHQMEAEESLK